MGVTIAEKAHRAAELNNPVDECDRLAWYKNRYARPSQRILHREGGPAVIDYTGRQEWYVDGRHHRDDGPAMIGPNGEMEWWQDNCLHRIGGPASQYPDCEHWCQYNHFHRDDGPAITDRSGYRAWFKSGRPHRMDGPSVVHPNGLFEWHVEGRDVTAEVTQAIADGVFEPFAEWTDTDLVAFRLFVSGI